MSRRSCIVPILVVIFSAGFALSQDYYLRRVLDEETRNEVERIIQDQHPPAPTGYAVAFLTDPIATPDEEAVAVQITGGAADLDYNLSIDDENGATVAITRAGTMVGETLELTGIDVSSLDDGTLTATLTLTDDPTEGDPVTDTATKDTVGPSGYAIAFDASDPIDPTVLGSVTLTGGATGMTLGWTITNGIDTPVSGGATLQDSSHQVTGIDLSGFGPGEITLTATLTDQMGNPGDAVIDTATLAVVITGDDTAGRNWSNGDNAINCNAYINNRPADHLYAGATGNGYYWIDPDGPGTGVDAFFTHCDMTIDGGGWTLTSRGSATGGLPGYSHNLTPETGAADVAGDFSIGLEKYLAFVDNNPNAIIQFGLKNYWGGWDWEVVGINRAYYSRNTMYYLDRACNSAKNSSYSFSVNNGSKIGKRTWNGRHCHYTNTRVTDMHSTTPTYGRWYHSCDGLMRLGNPWPPPRSGDSMMYMR